MNAFRLGAYSTATKQHLGKETVPTKISSTFKQIADRGLFDQAEAQHETASTDSKVA